MQTKVKTRPKFPRAKLLAVIDRAYDRMAIAQNDTELMEALGKLCGELGSFVETFTPQFKAGVIGEIKAEVADRIYAYQRLQRWASAPNTLQLRSDTMVARWPIPAARVNELCETLEGILGEPDTWRTKLQ